MISKFCKFFIFSLEFQKFFLFTRTFFFTEKVRTILEKKYPHTLAINSSKEDEHESSNTTFNLPTCFNSQQKWLNNNIKVFRILYHMEDWKGTRNLVKCQGHKSLIQLHNFFVSIVNSCLSEYVGSCIKWPVLLHVMKQYFNTKVKLMPRATFEGCCKIGQTFASSPYYSGP